MASKPPEIVSLSKDGDEWATPRRRFQVKRPGKKTKALVTKMLDGEVDLPASASKFESAMKKFLEGRTEGMDRTDNYKAMIQAMTDDLQALLPKMVETTRNSTEGSKGAYALATIVNTIQSLVGDLQEQDDPDEKYRIIEKEVNQPMMQNFISALANEIETAQIKIQRVAPPETHRSITAAFHSMVTGTGQKCATTYKENMSTLRTILGAKSK